MSNHRGRNVHRTHLDITQPNIILREVDYIVARAAAMETRVVTLDHLVFFSTSTGDAWLLDPDDGLALRLAVEGNPLTVKVVETDTRYVIEWAASYLLDGESFVMKDADGAHVFYGYPIDELARAGRRLKRAARRA